MKKLKDFFISLAAIVIMVGVVLVVSTVHSKLDEYLPLGSTITLLVAFAISLLIFYRSIRGYATWYVHIPALLVVGFGGYLARVKLEWDVVWGILAGIGTWLPAIGVDILLKMARTAILSRFFPEEEEGRTDKFGLKVDLDNPDPDGPRGLIDFTKMFGSAQKKIDVEGVEAVTGALGKLAEIQREWRKAVQLGLINEEQWAVAMKKLGITSLFALEEATSTSPMDRIRELPDLNDGPR